MTILEKKSVFCLTVMFVAQGEADCHQTCETQREETKRSHPAGGRREAQHRAVQGPGESFFTVNSVSLLWLF